MCRTFTLTYTLCLHTLTTHTPCARSRRIFSFFRGRCRADTGSVTINDFCPSCRVFFDEQDVSETTRRELVNSFRIVRAYYGSLTPMLSGEGGEIELRMDVGEHVLGAEDGEREQQVGGAHGSQVVGDTQDEGVTRLSMMNANWWAIGDEASSPSPSPPQSRRDSTSSTMTIWPSEPQEAETSQFDFDFEHLTAPEAAHLARDGLIHPDEFEVVNLNDPLPGPVFADGFENQMIHGLMVPLAVALQDPSRPSGEEERSDPSQADRRGSN
ncbi:hypothetical protein VTL71DRAFT_15601 [Oculimacula yallundae]|uniref:Uncharacterized protein n=1 Tax=Oculimacula yallundae TaxID=86028 RepID=A0ABR4CJ79_9HELO